MVFFSYKPTLPWPVKAIQLRKYFVTTRGLIYARYDNPFRINLVRRFTTSQISLSQASHWPSSDRPMRGVAWLHPFLVVQNAAGEDGSHLLLQGLSRLTWRCATGALLGSRGLCWDRGFALCGECDIPGVALVKLGQPRAMDGSPLGSSFGCWLRHVALRRDVVLPKADK